MSAMDALLVAARQRCRGAVREALLSSRSRCQQGILFFLARAEQQISRYAKAGIPKAEQAGEILEFAKSWNATPAGCRRN